MRFANWCQSHAYYVLIPFVAVPIFVIGCASLETQDSTVVIHEVEWPLLDLQKLVTNHIPVGVRETSPNGREFRSEYYVPNGILFKPAKDAMVRYTAQITILGDRRPYDIEIFVTRQNQVKQGQDFGYQEVGHDLRLAQQIQQNLLKALSKRREDRNIIDDFRVF